MKSSSRETLRFISNISSKYGTSPVYLDIARDGHLGIERYAIDLGDTLVLKISATFFPYADRPLMDIRIIHEEARYETVDEITDSIDELKRCRETLSAVIVHAEDIEALIKGSPKKEKYRYKVYFHGKDSDYFFNDLEHLGVEVLEDEVDFKDDSCLIDIPIDQYWKVRNLDECLWLERVRI